MPLQQLDHLLRRCVLCFPFHTPRIVLSEVQCLGSLGGLQIPDDVGIIISGIVRWYLMIRLVILSVSRPSTPLASQVFSFFLDSLGVLKPLVGALHKRQLLAFHAFVCLVKFRHSPASL